MRRGSVAGTCLMLALTSTAAGAQTNERAYESLEFRVVTPGARAVAMGKTFVGIADDATAAASNPAGLSNLLDPEISFEWSGGDIRHARMVSIDPIGTNTFTQTVSYPSFASFVTPLPDRRVLRDVTVAVFYNSLQRYKEQFSIPNFRTDGTRIPQGGYFGSMDISARTVGVGGSVLLSRKVSAGGSLTVQHLTADVRSNSGEPSNVRSGTITNDTDVKLAGQLGVLWKPRSPITIGAAYYAGASFTVTTTIFGVFSPENSPPLPPLPIEQIKTPRIQSPVQQTDYRIPDRATIGVSVRPGAKLTLLSDVAIVKYSQRITPNFLIVDFLAQPSAGLEPSLYTIADAVELHAGAEYRFIRGGRVGAIRGGVFTDPDHQMRFDYARSNQSNQARGQYVQFDSYFPGTIVGVTGGAGLVFGNRFQVDGAISWSANAREVVLSSVVRFPR